MSDERINHSTAMSDLIATLVDIVGAGVARRPAGVHLTWVGGEFAKTKKASFEQYVNHVVISDGIDIPLAQRKMAPFIERFCSDMLRLERTANQNYLVVLADSSPTESVQGGAVQHGVAERRFKKGVWPAFIRPITAGKSRYIDLDRATFTDKEAKPEGGEWRTITEEYVAGIPIGQSFDTGEIERLIVTWCDAEDVAIDLLTTDGVTETAPTLLDLARVIRSLPPALSASWMIPADVLRHLK